MTLLQDPIGADRGLSTSLLGPPVAFGFEYDTLDPFLLAWTLGFDRDYLHRQPHCSPDLPHQGCLL